jgi:hypothetical protein
MDWNYWLGRKYAQGQQEADANTTRANAGLITANADANLANVRAGLLPGQTAADIGLTKAQTGSVNVNTELAPGLAKASEAASYGRAKADTAQAGVYGAQGTGENQLNTMFSKAVGGDSTALQLLSLFFGRGLPSQQSGHGLGN